MMLTLASLTHDYPEETANRIMVRHGSTMLLKALRGEPLSPPPTRQLQRPKFRSGYIPMAARPAVHVPRPVVKIIRDVAEAFDLLPGDLTGRGRAKLLVAARSVAIRLVRDRVWSTGVPKYSTPQIGGFFNRDHTTIIFALDQFDTYCKHYPEVEDIYRRLSNGELGPCG